MGRRWLRFAVLLDIVLKASVSNTSWSKLKQGFVAHVLDQTSGIYIAQFVNQWLRPPLQDWAAKANANMV